MAASHEVRSQQASWQAIHVSETAHWGAVYFNDDITSSQTSTCRRTLGVDRPDDDSLQDHGIDFRLFATAW